MRTIRNSSTARAFLKGLASAVDIFPPVKVRQYPHSSVAAALQRDMMRTGNDMQKVIDRGSVCHHGKSAKR